MSILGKVCLIIGVATIYCIQARAYELNESGAAGLAQLGEYQVYEFSKDDFDNWGKCPLGLYCLDSAMGCGTNSMAKIFSVDADGDGAGLVIDDIVLKKGLLSYIMGVVGHLFHKENSDLYVENKKLKEMLANFMVTLSYLKRKHEEKDSLKKHIWDGINQFLAHNNKQNDDGFAFLNSCLQQLNDDGQSNISQDNGGQGIDL